MAKPPKSKTGGIKNPGRRNGKAWQTKDFDSKGRAVSGRGKPSGRSVKGTRVERVKGTRVERTFADVVREYNARLTDLTTRESQ